MRTVRDSELTGARLHTAWGFVHDVLLSAGRALALVDGGGAGDVLWRAGGLRRASGRRTRSGMVVAEAPRTRNGVYLMVARARDARRPQSLLRIGLVGIIGVVGIIAFIGLSVAIVNLAIWLSSRLP
jgi:hypothetical protein